MTIELLASARAGLESTRGTPVTPTRIIYFGAGGGSVNQDIGTIAPRESWANFTEHRRAYPGLERNTLRFSGDLTSDDAIFWLNLAVDAEASGSVTDTSAYDWVFLPVHDSDALKSATFEIAYKDFLSTWGAKLPGCIVNVFRVTWEKNVGGDNTGCRYEAEVMTASGMTDITAFGGSLSDRSVESMLGTGTATYLNSTGSAHGTTADTRVNRVTYEVNNNFVYRDGFNGTANAIEIVRTGPRATRLTAQRYFNDTTEMNAYRTKATRRFRVKTEGSLAGAATAKHKVQLDASGVWETHGQPQNVDGMIYANLEMLPLYDSALASDKKWTVTNTTASIT